MELGVWETEETDKSTDARTRVIEDSDWSVQRCRVTSWLRRVASLWPALSGDVFLVLDERR